MIVLETKHIKFGNGDVGVGSIIRTDGIGAVCFTDLDKQYEIGEKTCNTEENKQILVSLEFKKIESIDIVIKALERTKKQMLENVEKVK